MIRTGRQYLDSIRDGRRIWVNGERVNDVTTHPMFRPIVNIRARIYDMQHEDAFRDRMTYVDGEGNRSAIGLKLPETRQDWDDKRLSTDTVLNEVGGVVTRVGDETIGEMWSLYDGQDLLNEVDPRFAQNIRNHVARAIYADPFHVSANTDPKGDRSKRPQDQDPDMLLHVVKETDAGIIVRGAKYETAAAYANQAFTKPTIANWGDSALSDYAVGFVCDFSSPNLKFICRTGFAGRAPETDYPLSNRFDEVEALVVFDDVLIPWENVLFYRHTKAATFIRATLHRYSAFAFVQRNLKLADMMIGTALFNVRQTGLDRQQAVQEKLARLACYREGINAHLTAAIAMAEPSPGGLLMPNQSLLMSGRVLACSQLHEMMHLTRELCGGQICVTPDAAAFADPETGPWLQKFYTINENWVADDRRRLLAYARDLLNSDYAGHRLTFQLFAQSPPFAHLAAVYRNFDWNPSLDFVKNPPVSVMLSWESKDIMTDLPATVTHRRIRPFNTRETYPEQNLDNDLCQAVVAGKMVYLRGQVPQDLDTRENVAVGDPEGQARKVAENILLLLSEAGAEPRHICKVTVYLTDIRYREVVYRTLGQYLRGVFPVFTGLVVVALARPEWFVEVDIIAQLD